MMWQTYAFDSQNAAESLVRHNAALVYKGLVTRHADGGR